MLAWKALVREHALLLTTLLVSVAAHGALVWIGAGGTSRPELLDRDPGKTSIQVRLDAGSEAAAAPEPLEQLEAVRSVARPPASPATERPLESTPPQHAAPQIARVALDAVAARPPQRSEPEENLPSASIPPVELESPLETSPPRRSVARPEPRTTTEVADLPAPDTHNVMSRQATGAEVPPQYRTRVEPEYPPELLVRGIEGQVLLRVEVSATGQVTSASVHRSSGYPQMDQSALTAVRLWQFTPAQRAGRPVPQAVLVPIGFRIDRP